MTRQRSIESSSSWEVVTYGGLSLKGDMGPVWLMKLTRKQTSTRYIKVVKGKYLIYDAWKRLELYLMTLNNSWWLLKTADDSCWWFFLMNNKYRLEDPYWCTIFIYLVVDGWVVKMILVSSHLMELDNLVLLL